MYEENHHGGHGEDGDFFSENRDAVIAVVN
jgi:hypothetical protein